MLASNGRWPRSAAPQSSTRRTARCFSKSWRANPRSGSEAMLAIDHVILLAADLDHAAARLLKTHGLASLPGGRHPGHGTGNRIVPLGDSYLELMGVVDEVEA